jgi:D-aminopeptidase
MRMGSVQFHSSRPSMALRMPDQTPRARDLGIVIGDLPPGPANAITDVAGVRVGHTTLISGDGPLRVGDGPVPTGVTVIVPGSDDPWGEPAAAGAHRLNGNGELTGLEWVRESGLLTTCIGLTNTHSVGVVRDTLIAAATADRPPDEIRWYLPVVGETYDGDMSDINGMHVKPEHVRGALAAAAPGPVEEGGVGSGTGMVCHGFKGGIGTSSRVAGGHTVGVLVQANHGTRERLMVGGVPVGRAIGPDEVPDPRGEAPAGGGSIIVIVATDAPLLPGQCTRLAQRAALGVGRTGGAGENGSGDLMLAFATGNRGLRMLADSLEHETAPVSLRAVPAAVLDGLFYAAIEATEEAIVNALVAGRTMVGCNGTTAYGIPHDRLAELAARS